MVDQNIDINMQDGYRQTPLMYLHHMDIWSMLLTKGARVDIQDNESKTMLHPYTTSYRPNRTHFLEALLDCQSDLNSVTNNETSMESVLDNNLHLDFNILRRIRARGTHAVEHPPRDVQSYKWHFAITVTKLASRDIMDGELELLIKQQNAIDKGQYRGLTPLHFALLLKKTEITEKLLCAGADTTIHDNSWLSLMQYVVHCREATVLELLLERQGVHNAHNTDGHDALLMAIKLDNVEAVQMLLQYHYDFPMNLRTCLRMSQKTVAFLVGFCMSFLTHMLSNNNLCLVQDQVFLDKDISIIMAQHYARLSCHNTQVLHDYYKAQ